MRRLAWLSLALLATGCTEYDLDRGDNVVGGPQPDIEVDPMVLSWGEKLPDCPSDPKIVTIRNVGQSRLRVTDLSLGGDASAYTLTPPAGDIDLGTGESVELSVEFLAATTIPYTAALSITSNDPDEGTVHVDLTGEGGMNPTNEDTFRQDEPEAVDVLWVLDYSCSMGGVVSELETRFDEFIASFVALGLDYQIGVTTADMDSPTAGGRLLGPVLSSTTMTSAEIAQAFDDQVNPNSGQSATEEVLGAAYAALENPGYAVDDGLVRENGNLAVIVIGDEDDQSGGPNGSGGGSAYAQWMNAYKPDPDQTSISGIIPLASGNNFFSLDGCSDFLGLNMIGYAIDGTGGEKQNLCALEASFSDIMDWLSFTAAGLDTQFTLSSTPATGSAGMVVTVDGVPVSFDPFRTSGWSYDPGTNTVYFYGSSIPGPGADIVITYPISGTCSTL